MSVVKTKQNIDRWAREIAPDVRKSVYGGSKAGTEARFNTLTADYPDPDRLRETAGAIKQHTLENLDRYLGEAEASLQRSGALVHFAADAERANAIVHRILAERECRSVIKSKSMITEETHLADYLDERGIETIESDLGEFIVQIDGDHPSHIVKPIIHKNRREIATSFERHGLGEYNDDPETITRRARAYLRKKYFEADAGITGANFVSAESGRMVLVTNEGNARFTIAANRIHIAMVGIEKLVPKDRDLGLFANLIGRSGTGQRLTVYTQFINGPRRAEQPDGPDELHVIFVDNGRTEVLAGDCRSILRCIRCGACLNVCPIYRQAGGHSYRSVYPGPVGAVLSPLLAGERFPELADLPKASSLCGACNEVCPVDIPIPDLLLRLRDRAKTEKASEAMKGTPPMGMWALMGTQPGAWKTALKLGHTMNHVPLKLLPFGPLQSWQSSRDLPRFEGGAFRKWMKSHKAAKGANRNGGRE